MTFTSLKAAVLTELRRVTTWVNTALCAALPFAENIMTAVNTQLPELAPYLPENVYKAVGLAAVLFNIYSNVRRTQHAQA